MSAAEWILAAALGGCGAILRFIVDGAVSNRLTRDFPYGTLAVNLSGTILLGLLVGLGVHGEESLLLGSATIGGYTTFSTWMLETQRLVEDGERTQALGNVLISQLLGLAAIAIGRALGAHL